MREIGGRAGIAETSTAWGDKAEDIGRHGGYFLVKRGNSLETLRSTGPQHAGMV